MERIGGVCGSGATGHWIDIVGIGGRRISHSLASGYRHVSGRRRRVDGLLGFPREDGECAGPGVFSHVVKLENGGHAPADHHSSRWFTPT
ncbi:hypothetical protein ACHAW5_010050 [Stephanodiscus triporus]|uniref:Uncharacterized protein n=1 Tax=Stephanodiscus triporus TaxID=2934178 RepID=A0ABD3QN95_9STRA